MFQPSSVWHWYRGVNVGIDKCAGAFVVHHSTCIYSQWIPPMDYVFLEWYVANYFKKMFSVLVVFFFSNYWPPSSTKATVQIENVPTSASRPAVCRAGCHRVLRCLLDVFFRKTC